MIIGPMARPSRPSVRFTAFEKPTIIRTAKGIYQTPRSGVKFLKNGTLRCVSNPG